MINSSIHTAASTEDLIYKERKINITPKKGSMVEALVNQCIPYDGSAHTELEGHLVEELSKVILPHIRFAKNVVISEIEELAKLVNDQMTNAVNDNPINRIKIHMVHVPEIVEMDEFSDILTTYKDHKTPLVPENLIKLKTASYDEIVSLVLTNLDFMDESIKSWLTVKNQENASYLVNNDILTYVWSQAFDSGELLKKLHTYPEYVQVDLALVILLIARNLLDKTEYAENVEHRVWKKFIREVRDYAGVCLTRSVMRLRSYGETRMMIIDQKESELWVHGPVYLEWVKNGGKHEALLGLVINKENIISVKQITERENELVKAYILNTSMQEAVTKLDRFDLFRKTLKAEFDRSLMEPSEEEKEIRLTDPQYISTLTKLSRSFFDALNQSDMEDVYRTCMKLVAKVRFFFTDSYLIIDGIDQVTKINPKIEIREAAMLSTINYITHFIADQLDVNVNSSYGH